MAWTPLHQLAVQYRGRCRSTPRSRQIKQEVVTVGLDLAKSVFQVHAIGRDGAVLVRRKLRRAEIIGFFADLPECLVGMEACASPITGLGS
jgi:hypothetical protein